MNLINETKIVSYIWKDLLSHWHWLNIGHWLNSGHCSESFQPGGYSTLSTRQNGYQAKFVEIPTKHHTSTWEKVPLKTHSSVIYFILSLYLKYLAWQPETNIFGIPCVNILTIWNVSSNSGAKKKETTDLRNNDILKINQNLLLITEFFLLGCIYWVLFDSKVIFLSSTVQTRSNFSSSRTARKSLSPTFSHAIF